MKRKQNLLNSMQHFMGFTNDEATQIHKYTKIQK